MFVITYVLYITCRARFCKNTSHLKLKVECREASVISPRKNAKCFQQVSLRVFKRPWILWTGNWKFRYKEPKSIPRLQVQNFIDFQVQLRVKLNILDLSLFCRLLFCLVFFLSVNLLICLHLSSAPPCLSWDISVLCAIPTWIYFGPKRSRRKTVLMAQYLLTSIFPVKSWDLFSGSGTEMKHRKKSEFQ